MKKNLLYLLMLLVMPFAFVACGDDEEGNDGTMVVPAAYDASGIHAGTIKLFVNGENFFTAMDATKDSSPIEFNLTQGEAATSLTINDELDIIGPMELSVENIPSSADANALTLKGNAMNAAKNIIGIDVVISSITGTFSKDGKGTLYIEASAPDLGQTVTIEIASQKK